jgi:hypothetical protein
MGALVQRLKEPSSYAAIAGVLALVGVQLPEGLWDHVVTAGAAAASLAAFFLPERGARAE